MKAYVLIEVIELQDGRQDSEQESREDGGQGSTQGRGPQQVSGDRARQALFLITGSR